MFTVNFYVSCVVSRGNSIGKKLIRLDWEKAVYWLLFALGNTLPYQTTVQKLYKKYVKIIQNTKFLYNLYTKIVQIKFLYSECTRNVNQIPICTRLNLTGPDL